jgi:hypothetical protein
MHSQIQDQSARHGNQHQPDRNFTQLGDISVGFVPHSFFQVRTIIIHDSPPRGVTARSPSLIDAALTDFAAQPNISQRLRIAGSEHGFAKALDRRLNLKSVCGPSPL